MTVLGDRLSKLSTSNKHIPCPMAKLLKSLDTDTAVALIDVMSKEEIPTRTIYLEIHNAGIPMARESVQMNVRAQAKISAKSTKSPMGEQSE